MELDFRQVNAYELPKQLASLAIQNRLDAAPIAFQEVLSGKPLLTVDERRRVSEPIRQGLGIDKSPVTDTFLELATNPLVYLSFLPELGPAWKLGTGAIKYSPWLRKNPTVLQALGLESGLQMFRGTSTTPVLSQVMHSMEATTRASGELLDEPLKKVLRKTGLDDIRLGTEPLDGPKAVLRKRLDALLHIYLEGLNRDTVERIPAAVVRGADGKLSFRFKEQTKSALVDIPQEQLEATLRDQFDALDLAKALRQDRDSLRDQVFGTNPKEWRERASRMYFAMRGVGGSEGLAHLTNGKRALQGLFGARMERAVTEGKKIRVARMGADGKVLKKGGRVVYDRVEVQADEWGDLVSDYMRGSIDNPDYLPRNMYTTRNGNGVLDDAPGAARDNGLVAGNATIPRANARTVFDEDDLAELQDVQHFITGSDRPTAEMSQQLGATARYDKPKNLRRRINAIDSLDRYRSSMVATKALFIDSLSEGTLALEKEVLDKARSGAGVDAVTGTLRKTGLLKGKPADIWTPIADVAPESIPAGGFTAADALDRSYRLMRNELSKDMLRDAILPRVMGEATASHHATSTLLVRAKDAARWMVGSKVGEVFKDSKSMRPVYDYMERVSKSEFRPGRAGSFQSDLTGYLYGTHLGLNLKSVVFNMTQPFVTMVRYGNLDDVVKGYGKALDQLGGYYNEMFSNPKKFLSLDATRAAQQKHFRFVEPDEDLLGLTEDLMGQLDIGLAQSQDVLRREKLTGLQKLMLPFQQGELVNRVAAAEIAAQRAGRQGLNAFSKDAGERAAARQEIGQFVQESQFGASLLNTMGAAYGQGRLSFLEAPIFRQFLTFPVRMATMPFATDARISDLGFLRSLGLAGRSVGYSAVAYELLRSDLLGGTDASPYLAIAGQTQVLTGFADDRDGPLPIPPAIGIPANLVRGLATGDQKMIANEVSRALPGGIAGFRVLKSLDPLGALGVPEETRAAFNPYNRVLWDQPGPDGAVPVLDNAGRLIATQTPLQLGLRAAGLDFNQFQTQVQEERFLLAQREQMVAAEQEIIRALLRGDQDAIIRMSEQFERRFGFKPTIDRGQVQRALENRTVSRQDRIAGRIDPELRARLGIQDQATDPGLRGEASVAVQALQNLLGVPQ